MCLIFVKLADKIVVETVVVVSNSKIIYKILIYISHNLERLV